MEAIIIREWNVFKSPMRRLVNISTRMYVLCSVKMRGGPFSKDFFKRSLKQYLISLEIIGSILLC